VDCDVNGCGSFSGFASCCGMCGSIVRVVVIGESVDMTGVEGVFLNFHSPYDGLLKINPSLFYLQDK
jgi:hypothetical protein